jgi:hypothetical protein
VRGRHCCGAVAALVLLGTPAQGQSWSTLATDVFTTLRWGGLAARDTWRDLHHGDAEVRLGAAHSWGGPGAGSTSLVLQAEGQTALSHRTDMSDRLHVAGFAIRELNDDGAAIWGGADFIGLPSADVRALTAELSAGGRVRLPWWLPSRRPLFIVEGAGDVNRYRAMYVRSALRFDYEVGKGLGAFIEAGQAWSGLPGGDATGSVPFGNHGTDISLRTTIQRTTPTSKTWSFEPFVRERWITRNADPNLFDAGVRVELVY